MNRRHTRSSSHPGLPGWLWVPLGLGAAFLLLPLVGLASRVDLSSLSSVITSRESALAMGLSLLTSVISALVCVVVGFPLGYVFATRDFRGRGLVRPLVLLPLVLPPVVSGLALLYTFGRTAVIGSALESAGIGLAFTTAAVTLAQIFVSLPFMVMSVETAVAARDTQYELAAAELGARPNRVFFSVTLPLLKQGILTGAVLCFARSLGEFGATLTFAGSLSGVTRTMPLQIYLVRESDPQAAIALSLLLVAVALLIIVIAYRSPHAPRFARSAARHADATAHDTTNDAVCDSVDGDVDGAVDERILTSVRSSVLPAGALSSGGGGVHSDPNGSIEFSAVLSDRGVAYDLSIPAGRTAAVIGRNGAGKSTILSIMSGALRPESGALTIGERTVFDLQTRSWPAVHERGIVHLSQNPLLFPHLTVVDNVAFGLRVRGISRAEAARRAAEMLDRLDVGECSARRVHEVSGGQAARIALARALVVDPTLLLLDEPLAALDVDVKIGTRQVLAEVLVGRSALLITHDVADVAALADRLILIDAGQVAYNGPASDVDASAARSGADFLTSFCGSGEEGILSVTSH